MTTVVITQSNYIPWRGYFDLIRQCDHFVFYDCVQFTRRDWRNRNRIVTRAGPQWLTIPVESKGRYHQAIDETAIADPDWAQQHLATLHHAYGKTRLVRETGDLLDALYREVGDEKRLSRINRHLVEGISGYLGIGAAFHDSRDFALADERSERLLGICRALGATRYLSGPAAKDYLNVPLFEDAGVAVAWMRYPEYRPYRQADGGYEAGASILDTLAYLEPGEVFDAS